MFRIFVTQVGPVILTMYGSEAVCQCFLVIQSILVHSFFKTIFIFIITKMSFIESIRNRPSTALVLAVCLKKVFMIDTHIVQGSDLIILKLYLVNTNFYLVHFINHIFLILREFFNSLKEFHWVKIKYKCTACT